VTKVKKVLLFIGSLGLICLLAKPLDSREPEKWWKKWPSAAKEAPRISADQVSQLFLSGARVVFVYAGYEKSEIVCGSIYIPYTLVPPRRDGSGVKLGLPKDTWIMCYCP
jgi:hypothetical protein